ncbi:hypothetical protein CEUSTIGMA_g13628.t1 [Chlamydomonas eustigma]|uniref:Uncharacterized protein n=1 Tax=Chlamydomonas eustigma TaxID=1157962 RepID=A0A250XT27_9CHLO|nr:hypothetical protein CEUSTIGMA_g13628.t1 [Chlamydomonas eustigma]|eukprot:GAX86215.1 hypothetical protein CEUSTIGMA_g13628.t1 [Chlamydomonas eustigma]
MATDVEFVVNFDTLFTSTDVQVIQSVDFNGLKDTLKWILEQLKNRPNETVPQDLKEKLLQLSEENDSLKNKSGDAPGSQELKDDVLKLRDENEALRNQLQELQASQAIILDKLDALSKADQRGGSNSQEEKDPAVAITSDLEHRVAALEARQQAPSDGLEPLKERVSALEAAIEGLGSDVSGHQPSHHVGPSKEDLEALKLALGDKATKEDLDNLRHRLDNKADRSELDAVLQATVNSAAAEAAPTLSVGEDGTIDQAALADAVNRVVNEVQSVRTLIIVLQERVAGKADQALMDDVRSQTEALRGMLNVLQSQISEPSSDVGDLEQRLRALEAALQSGGTAQNDASHDSKAMKENMEAQSEPSDLDAPRSQISALSDRMEVFNGSSADKDKEIVGGVGGVGGEADATRLRMLEESLAAVKEALGEKADADHVHDISDKVNHALLGLSKKADQAALDELRLRFSLLGSGGGGGEGGGVNVDSLLEVLKGMLLEKASQAELETMKQLLNGKAERDEVETLAIRVHSAGAEAAAAAAGAVMSGGLESSHVEGMLASRASQEQVSTLAQQMGDMFAELEKLRGKIALMPREVPVTVKESSDASDGAAAMKLAAALGRDLQVMKDQVDLVAHATNIISVGMEPIPPTSQGQENGGGVHHAIDTTLSPTGKERRDPRGAYERLLKLLGSQGVHQKMDYFDPEILNRMAHKVAAVDALMKNPSFHISSPDVGLKDLEAQVRRLSREVRAIRERLGDGGSRMADSDHAMLSGKPLMGYRCLACDRPLEKLDERSGPYLPSQQMPISPEVSTKKVPKGSVIGPEASGAAPGSAVVPGSSRLRKAYDPSQRGPQNWYEESHGAAAEGLPKEDVGPKLPPGGWSSISGGKAPGLPDLVGGPSPGLQGKKQVTSDNGATAGLVTLPHI